MTMLMNHLKTLLMVAMFGLGTLGLAGCDDDGAFENAGEEVDEAGENMQDQMDDAEDELD